LAIPQDCDFDLVVAIGVLHHVENPGPIVQAARGALRPGGVIFIWLYGREGNGTYLALIEPLRAITKRMPHRALASVCHVIDLIAMIYTVASQIMPLPMRQYMQTVYCQLTPDKRRW
jgi:SAM-dependent methyltransferase